MRLDMATADYIGARAQQQDAAAVQGIGTNGGAILVLADGLGGHESGAEAARIVVETFKEAAGEGALTFGDPRAGLRAALERANQRIGDGANPAHGHRGMASTAVAAIVDGGLLKWVSVGDSHLYLWRSGRLAKLNEDHSQAGLMVRSGQYKASDPEVQAVKSVLVSALTGRHLELVDDPEHAVPVTVGDVVLLASDGLNTLEDHEIEGIVLARQGEGALRLSAALLETVRARRVERQDNTTVAVARILDPAPVAVEAAPSDITQTSEETAPSQAATEIGPQERALPPPLPPAAPDVVPPTVDEPASERPARAPVRPAPQPRTPVPVAAEAPTERYQPPAAPRSVEATRDVSGGRSWLALMFAVLLISGVALAAAFADVPGTEWLRALVGWSAPQKSGPPPADANAASRKSSSDPVTGSGSKAAATPAQSGTVAPSSEPQLIRQGVVPPASSATQPAAPVPQPSPK